MEPSPPVKTPRKPDTSWNPVILSVVVYPGIGQFMQRRMFPALAYFCAFTLIVLVFSRITHLYLKEVVELFNRALSGEAVDAQGLPPIKYLLKPLAVLLLIYFANVFDIFRGRSKLIKTTAQK
jgi:hypothetical protein